jgi:hypothetical protein
MQALRAIERTEGSPQLRPELCPQYPGWSRQLAALHLVPLRRAKPYFPLVAMPALVYQALRRFKGLTT